jgi:hypothetical protein
MQYAVDDALTTDGKGIPWNQALSPTDVHDLRTVYAFATPPAPPQITTPVPAQPNVDGNPPPAPANPPILPPPAKPPVAPPNPPPPNPKGPTPVGSVLPAIIRLLSFINGYIDLVKLEEVVVAAEAKQPGLESAIQAIKANETVIFRTTLARMAADEILGVALTLYQHGGTAQASGAMRQFDASMPPS